MHLFVKRDVPGGRVLSGPASAPTIAPAGQTCAQIVQPVQRVGSISAFGRPFSFFSSEPMIAGHPTLKQAPHAVQMSGCTA